MSHFEIASDKRISQHLSIFLAANQPKKTSGCPIAQEVVARAVAT
jgi:hypothetical protein